MKKRILFCFIFLFTFSLVPNADQVNAGDKQYVKIQLTDTDMLPQKVDIKVTNVMTLEEYPISLTRVKGYKTGLGLPAGTYEISEKTGKHYEIEKRNFKISDNDKIKKIKINSHSTDYDNLMEFVYILFRTNIFTLIVFMLVTAGWFIVRCKNKAAKEKKAAQ